jgi:hypothetical protein
MRRGVRVRTRMRMRELVKVDIASSIAIQLYEMLSNEIRIIL